MTTGDERQPGAATRAEIVHGQAGAAWVDRHGHAVTVCVWVPSRAFEQGARIAR